MKIGNAAIGKLARMICGDEPWGKIFPYRSSSNLTAFFEGIDLDYVHDGSTRYWWVRSVLTELNDLPEKAEEFPSPGLSRAIEYLVDPDHFDSDIDHIAAVNAVNDSLRRYELKIVRQEQTGCVHLSNFSENYVSTAKTLPEALRTITFSPAVFSVPEKEQERNLVAVMMPFSAEYSKVYEAIKGACKDADLSCYRADDIWEESTFIQDIFNLIFQSSIVIVDFYERNPNVMYETGISHTLGKSVVPLTQNFDDIPSDLKPHRALKYLPNNEGLTDLREQLAARLRTISEKLT